MKPIADLLERETKTRFSHDEFPIIQWWAKQLGVSVSELVRECTRERLAQLAVSKGANKKRRAA